MPLQIIECEQGTEAWHAARCGIITASCMKDVLAKGQGKTRAAYMHKLIGEVFTGEAAESYSNAHMERGKQHEAIARELYQTRHAVEVKQVGFMRNHDDIGTIGYSPDGLVGDDGAVEFKSNSPHILVELIIADKVPSEHWAQTQCGLWVSERNWIDLVCSYPGLPPFEKRIYRDEQFIREMMFECVGFYREMKQKIEAIQTIATRR